MCIGLAGQVVALPDDHPDLAKVDIAGEVRAVNLGLLDPGAVAVGDWVLVHLGFAIERMEPADARDAMDLLADLAGDGH